jgi:hypothetical protein
MADTERCQTASDPAVNEGGGPADSGAEGDVMLRILSSPEAIGRNQ